MHSLPAHNTPPWALEALPPDPLLGHAVLQVRERLTRGVLAGLQALTSTRRLVPSLFQAVCEFMHFSLVEAGGGRRDEHEIRSGVALSYLGRLPLRRLLQLHAFLALRIVDTVAAPKELDRELQASKQGGRQGSRPCMVLAWRAPCCMPTALLGLVP